MRTTVLCMLAVLAANCACAAGYDYDKLTGASDEPKFVFHYQGVAHNSSAALSRFAEVDSRREDERIRRQRSYSQAAAAAPASTGTSGSSSAPAAGKSMKIYMCTIYCNSASGPTITREVQASSRSDAAKFMDANSDKICQNTGFRKASSIAFPENQCRER